MKRTLKYYNFDKEKFQSHLVLVMNDKRIWNNFITISKQTSIIAKNEMEISGLAKS